MAKFSKLKTNDLLKTILIFFFYFAYTNLASLFCEILGVSYDLTVALYADCIFMLIIVFIYQDNIKKDLRNLRKDYNWKKLLFIILGAAIVIFLSYILLFTIAGIIFPSIQINPYDDNTKKIVDLYNISRFYIIFKSMIFGVVAEELLFKESVRDVVNNKWLFVLISALIYTAMNFIYTDFTSKTLIIDMVIILFQAIISSIIYVKNKSNIVVYMLIKFVYNLIPLTILLLGL